ncbi:gap junction delta-3 protein [Ambystoma mexicanum]|uniref:gap junction delta-3 protein n=1 Tax=Ambystoma mexicanum TaxID=8296 RepID=UPI0037E949E3
MGEWSFLSSLLDAVQEHSPMVGRFWLVVMLIFRILILATVGSDVFEDEQEEFVCNTLQPGCRQVCYDKAFPISHYRFWVFHIVLLSAPAVLFVIYSMHQGVKMNREEEVAETAPEAETSAVAVPKSPRRTKLRVEQRIQHIRTFYIVNVVLRIMAEVGFLVGQWLLYGFKVELQFNCTRKPCPDTVHCFVSRPTEKTIFVQFYFVVGVVSTILSLAELGHLIFKDRCRRPMPPSYDQDNWSNREQEKSRHFLLQARHLIPQRKDGARGSQSLPNHFNPSTVFQPKSPASTPNSSKSSRSTARVGDLTV